jgi:hypothetical protein
MGRKKSPETGKQAEESPRQSVELPTLTHLQFLVLDLMGSQGDGTSAQQLQANLLALNVDQTGPKFYQLMKRLEEGGYVESSQTRIEVAGGEVQRTFYKITNAGTVAWRLTGEFYVARLRANRILA